jgi:thiamine-monophosphate kinase
MPSERPTTSGPRLSDLGEDQLLARILALAPSPAGPAAGPGDDCAVVDEFPHPTPDDVLLLLKTDAVVEAVHYTPETDARRVGWKAIARVVSDFAAMGGTPDRFLVTLALPADRLVAWVEALYRGIAAALESFGGKLAGGETTAVPAGSAAVISIAATGRVARRHLVLRTTARPGDAIFATGGFGGSFASGRHLDIRPRLEESSWLVRHYKPSAMMDVSDGPAADLPRLAGASGAAHHVAPASLPRNSGASMDAAWNDGEDFELLFTQPPAHDTPEFVAAWSARFPETPLTRLGTIVAPGCASPAATGGWQHFATTERSGAADSRSQ